MQISDFRGPGGPGPVPSAVGVSVALDKICAAVASMEEPVGQTQFFYFCFCPGLSRKGYLNNESFMNWLKGAA